MAVHILPILKALAPYIASLATAAVPAFTSKSESAKIDPIVAKQIEELQSAATQNAESIHTLAERFQQAIQEVEIAAQVANKQVATFKSLLVASVGLSALSLSLCIYLLATRT